MFGKIEGYSHVDQDMIWLAEYYSGSLLEFDLKTKKPNSFYDINKDKLQRFGLIGNGHKMWFECYRGPFNIRGSIYNIIYKDKGIEYALTGQNIIQRDIITFKSAVAEVDLIGRTRGTLDSSITGYYFGYKTSMEIKNLKFNFKILMSIPVGDYEYFDIHIVANDDMNGELIITKNGVIVDQLFAPLKKGVAGGMKWKIN